MSAQPYHQQTVGSGSGLVAADTLLGCGNARVRLDQLQGGCHLGAVGDDVATL